MDPKTVIEVVKGGAKAAKAVYAYVDKDLHTYYGLSEPAWATFVGKGVGVLGKAPREVREVFAGPLRITFVSPDQVRLSSAAFAASSKYWNGPNVIPDDLNDGSFEMSLWHDLTWAFAERIAEILGVTEQEVMKWADGILAAAYRGYGKKHGKNTGWKAWLAYNVVERARGWWHRLFPPATTVLFVAFFLAGCGGCLSPPPWEMDDSSEVKVAETPSEAVQCSPEPAKPADHAEHAEETPDGA